MKAAEAKVSQFWYITQRVDEGRIRQLCGLGVDHVQHEFLHGILAYETLDLVENVLVQ